MVWRWFDKVGNRLARRLDASLFEEFSQKQPTRPAVTFARVLLVAVSALVVLSAAAAFLGGAALVVMHSSAVGVAIGLEMMLAGWLFRPRLGRRAKRSLGPEQAPGLQKVIALVAEHIGTPAPDDVVLDLDYNASFGRLGLRRRRTLRIGLMLWASLGPQARIALLAHELGHDVNGDPTTGLLVHPALAAFGQIADWTGADRGLGSVFHPDRAAPSFVQLLGELMMWAVSRPFLFMHLALTAIGLRDHQRAEYLADRRATEIAGTEGALSLTDRLLVDRLALTTVAYSAETHAPDRWCALVDTFLHDNPHAAKNYGQLSRRHTTIWHSHPPAGLRAAVIANLPHHDPALVLPPKASTQIDRELAPWYKALHNDLLGTRAYRPPTDS